jgi:hypothetical protein
MVAEAELRAPSTFRLRAQVLEWTVQSVRPGKVRGIAMNSGATWNERGLSPELYQAAREAARRAGMSVEEWLSATFGAADHSAHNEASYAATSGSRFEGTEPEAPSRRGARLSDTVAKLNARLEQLTSGRDSPPDARAAPEPRRSPRLLPSPASTDNRGNRGAPARSRSSAHGAAGSSGSSRPPGTPGRSMRRRPFEPRAALNKITAQIEMLRHQRRGRSRGCARISPISHVR